MELVHQSRLAEHAGNAAIKGSVASSGRRARVRFNKEIFITISAIALTLVSGVLASYELSVILLAQLGDFRWLAASGHLVFAIIIIFLVYGILVYLFTRLAYLVRRKNHRPTPDSELNGLWDGQAPLLTVLVPSYREEPEVVRLTLLTAALQDYPNRRVVLLIDDPPTCQDPHSCSLLSQARALPDEINALLRPADLRMKEAEQEFLLRRKLGTLDLDQELLILASLYGAAAEFFAELDSDLTGNCHVKRVFRDRILLTERDRLTNCSTQLRQAGNQPHHLTADLVQREYRRLATLFSAEITSFERKRYQNLSHQPSKAMNLNAYIGLMGKGFVEHSWNGRLHLVEADTADTSLVVPDADYLITLDADSLILPDYAKRLIWLAEQPANSQVAVLQTPYSAFPQAPGILERIAGATTDIQYRIHQGFTGYAATYWVGANALLRKMALHDIAVHDTERGFDITIFIQDRTVIEDTESTVDLINAGWRLYNYPERLAYSATPPDFGSLLIQRRRWANGGLIILPKLLRYLARTLTFSPKWLAEAFQRMHYLVSIAAINFGLVIILCLPLTDSIESIWLPLTALPYFLLYARDLGLSGYRQSDVFRVYALNLVLIPVNIGGVCKSIQQAVTRKKIPFARTPKVLGRTAVAPVYLLAEYALILGCLGMLLADIVAGRGFHAVFVGVNLLILTYGFGYFVGFRNSIEDIRAFLHTTGSAVPQEVADTSRVVPLRRLATTVDSGGSFSQKAMAVKTSESVSNQSR